MSTQIHGLLRTVATALVLLWASGTYAQEVEESYEAGVEAYEADEFARAEEIWLPLAEAGDVQAQYALAKLYENGGEGVMRSLTKAADWYLLASEAGLADAQNNLALLYIKGHGVPRSEERAFQLWLDAAENEHQQAQYNVALAYYEGMGTDQDHSKAAEWFERSASSGLAESQFALAEMYRLGVGVDENRAHALYWYELAETQGHERASAEVEELKDAGVSSREPDMTLEEVIPEDSQRSEAGQASGDIQPEPKSEPEEKSDDEVVADQAQERPDEQDTAVESDQSESVVTESDEEMEVVGGEEVPGPEEEATARNLFPTDQDREKGSAGEDVKKNGDPAVADEVDTAGAVELYPERMARLAQDEVDGREPERDSPNQETSSESSTEPRSSAGAIATDSLAEMRTDPLYDEEETGSSDSSSEEHDSARGSGEERAEPSATTSADSAQSQAGQSEGSEALDFALWLGSMASPEGARRLWEEAVSKHQESLSGLTFETREVQTDSGTFLRVLGVGYATETEAREVCARIESRDEGSFCQVLEVQ
ncbi:tetratricopeptide repeat protein [Fodinicurvata sediminis]|uniref:tetratricopeptide repeat protein n=1 Tax=Fodinicurvata sediminis TaxID=1121832 RepID=UPI0003B755AD|nr:tetratricopeptide repeat protein [Fodinicurvata sediminis]